ncbi:hypothetical protein conserved [Leishmania donovani]|uniref:Hypothetical_protein_conserved n=1 Tax=Leishmania donovani TaxID=5661 RepID=A0A504Y3T6_LEIDO|nr:hypothetical protein CGC20_22660 [Leishmania donovani]CAJ1988513.1 hypothetical protein conserved [Leishmania donovani]VDZ44394.1 hypothetical_protein_conserved [Leishmania donovani]
MQPLKRIRHPSGSEILFDAKWHQYKLGGTTLRSVSKLLDRFFPFDEKRVLELVSKKTGQPVDKIKQGWSRQALLGKNVHEFIECKLLKKPPPTFTLLMKRKQAREAARPADATGPAAITTTPLEDEVLHGEEALYLPVAEMAVEKVLSAYDVLGAEQVIAAPGWGIAGTIDFMGRNRRTNRVLIGDWKTTGGVTSNFRFGAFETACPGALRHLPNSKTYRYAMQVIIYGEILAREQYFEKQFFDAQLRASLTASLAVPSTDVMPPAPPAKTRGRPSSQAAAPAKSDIGSDVESLLKTFYHNSTEQRFEYGIVQLAKGEDGGVVAEFKEVTPSTVMPPDCPEMTFDSLLQRVMEGVGV